MHRLLAPVALSLALAAAGCGGDGSKESAPASGGGGSPQDASKPKAGSKSKAGTKVDMKNIQFVPMNVTVKMGQTVTWTNSDSVAHNVTKEGGPGADFKSSTLNGGDTFSHTFTAAGKFDYVCTIHPSQTGNVTVK